MKGYNWFKRNGLSIACFILFLLSFVGHIFSGLGKYNNEEQQNGHPTVTLSQFLGSGEFLETVFENWESEFLQMGIYVILTAILVQKGSAESRDPDEPQEERLGSDSPGPVRKGGLARQLYSHSLSVALLLMFIGSFILHLYHGTRAFNHEAVEQGQKTKTVGEFAESPEFWYQSFQNWQSEFLSIGVLVVLSIYLREKGSPQSKPVTAPHSKTGAD